MTVQENLMMELFIECFFEAQASIRNDLKRLIGKKRWSIAINDGKSAHEVSRDKYFMEKFINAGLKLDSLFVFKMNLSEDEKKLLIKCSTNVRHVIFLYYPLKMDQWVPEHKIEHVLIWTNAIVSKNEFKGFLPWIRLAENLVVILHKDFMSEICEWFRGTTFKSLSIHYRDKAFLQKDGKINSNIKKLNKLKMLIEKDWEELKKKKLKILFIVLLLLVFLYLTYLFNIKS